MIVDWSLEECTFEIRRVGLPKMFGLDLLNLPRQRAGLKQKQKKGESIGLLAGLLIDPNERFGFIWYD